MKGYERFTPGELTSSMEDYLGVVCRMEEEGEPIRVSSPATSLYMRPPSASKMLDNPKEAGYVDSRKYGSIMITEKGYEKGRYLLRRHQVPQDLFCTLNRMEDGLELAEKTRHFINYRTMADMERALSFLWPKNGITGKIG